MDDSFVYRTTVPIRREVNPRVWKAAFAIALVVIVVGLFARWVTASERRSLVLHPVPIPEVTAPPETPLEPRGTVRDAQEALQSALLAARAAYTDRRTFLDADPARLGELQPGFVYVDGPSTTARIVSVDSTDDRWAAAVLGPDDVCRWIGVDPSGAVVRGTADDCTASAALASLEKA